MKFAVLNMLVSTMVVYCVFLVVVGTLLMTRYVKLLAYINGFQIVITQFNP